jgi:hypothetical protein
VIEVRADGVVSTSRRDPLATYTDVGSTRTTQPLYIPLTTFPSQGSVLTVTVHVGTTALVRSLVVE